MSDLKYDTIIIGAGVSGCAVARELSRYDLKICVLDKESDVCEGTSKANSGIVHAGHDAKPDTLKAKLNVQGNLMMEEMAKKLDFPFKRNGSLVVCQNEEELSKLEELKERGKENGVEGLRILTREEALELEPALADSVYAALYAPTGGIVCPFLMNIAYAENAAVNGVEFRLGTCVQNIQKCQISDDIYNTENEQSGSNIQNKDDECNEKYEENNGKQVNGFEVITNQGIFFAKYVINAAGVYADEIHNMVSEKKLHITPRRGEYCLLDKNAGTLVSHTIFQVPGEMGKGVLVTPTIHGNLMIGPTADDVPDKEDNATTRAGLDKVLNDSAKSVKGIPTRQVITSFAGLRAHEDGGDFQIEELTDVPGFIDVAGIESPGLTSAPAIGVYVCDLVKKMMEDTDRQINPGDSGNLRSFEVADKQKSSGRLQEKENFIETRKGIVHFAELSLEEQKELIQKNPAYGQVICRCETVTEGEILDAIRRPLGARTLDGVKRRVRAGMGRCQGGFCTPRIMEILSRECGIPLEEICKNNPDSRIIVGTNKDRL